MFPEATSTPTTPTTPAATFKPRAPIFPLDHAHAALIEAIQADHPHHIRFNADHSDLEARTEHVESVMKAMAVYVRSVLEDTSDNCFMPMVDVEYIDGCLSDITSDIVGSMQRAAEDLAEAA